MKMERECQMNQCFDRTFNFYIANYCQQHQGVLVRQRSSRIICDAHKTIATEARVD
jgi:hypothetical protein